MLAFSDGVFAIIITIMVLELHAPAESDLSALAPLLPKALSYVLSFLYVAFYWVAHHHLMAATDRVNGRLLWANIVLLFFLSLLPFTTAWLGETRGAALPTFVYGLTLLAAALCYTLLLSLVLASRGKSWLALLGDWQTSASLLLYLAGLIVTFLHPAVAQAIFVFVALLWLIPNRHIERTLGSRRHPTSSD